MFFKPNIILFIFFSFFCIVIKAQEPPMWQLTDEDGLPSMTVYDIMQDQFGYIWFGTAKGLSRFDGNEFKRYTNPASRGKGITNLYTDNEGRIWCQNFVGQFFYIEDDSMQILDLPNQIPETDSFIIIGQNLILNTNPVYSYNTQSKQWKIHHLFPKNKVKVHFIEGDSLGNIWIASSLGIGKYDKNLNFITKYNEKYKGNTRLISSKNEVIYINEDKENALYTITNNQTRKVFEDYTVFAKNNRLNSVMKDRFHNIWLCTYSGLLIFDKDMQVHQPFFHILKDKSISRILQDREGNYWIASLRSGIFVIPNLNISYYNQNNSTILHNNINKLAKDNLGNLYIGFNNGEIKKFNFQEKFEQKYSVLKHNNIEALFYDTLRQTLWVGCGLLYRENTKQNKLLEMPLFGVIKDIQILLNNYLLLATNTSAYIVRVDNIDKINRIKQYFTSSFIDNNIISLEKNRAYKVWVEQRSKRFWVAYKKGLFYYENAKALEVKNPNNQQAIYGISFTQTNDGSIWVGTIAQGIFRIKNKKVIQHYSTENGLVSNFCNVLQSQENELWIATDRGIQILDIKNKTWNLFNKQDGLVSYDIMDMLVNNDSIWLGTPKGLLFFQKKALQKNMTPPLIYINTVEIWDKIQVNSDRYLLAYNENNIKISFKGIAYRSKGKFRYKYRMLGLDSTWIYSESSNNSVRYQSLPTGKYEFQVKAVNEDNIESEGTAIVEFVVSAPFWQRTWFITFLAFLVLTTLFLVFKVRLKNIRKKAKIEKDLRSSQLTMLKVQMNPHFIFNALNSIQEFILLNESRLANRFLGKFADLIRLTLEMSNQTEVSIEEEIDALKLYLELEALRFEDSLTYTFYIDSNIENQATTINIPSLLIQPYVENALKHGLLHKKENRTLSIEFKLSNNNSTLYCQIEDNGIGRKKSQEINQRKKGKYKSFAMSATKKRLELLNHKRSKHIAFKIIDLYDEKQNATGTRVELCIPI